MTSLNRKLIGDLKQMRTQVFTIALLIVGGISVLVSSWSSYQSLQNSQELFYQQYRFADIFAEVVRAPLSVAQRIGHLPGVDSVEARIVEEGLVDVAGQLEPALGRFISWPGDTQRSNLIYLRQGRMPQVSANTEVVVHESFASAHKLKMGDRLQVLLGGKQRTFIISGIGLSPEFVYALSPIAPLPDDKHFGIFWLRQADLEAAVGMNHAFNSLLVAVSDPTFINPTKQRIDQILKPYGNIGSYDRSRQLSNLFVEDEIRQQRVMAFVMPIIFLAVAMFILNIILSRLISLHRGQIATLKSLGYSNIQLTLHYFQLVTIILMIGIIPSLIVGSWIGKWYASLYEDFFRFPSIDFSLSMSAIGMGILAGLLSGWLGTAGALRRVFFLRPAEAMRPPNPPSFHRGLFERLFVGSRFNNFSKMMLRSLLFRPVRLFMSVLGMAAALAILINGSFWTDVIDFMLDRQFHQMRREDLTVRLAHPHQLSVVSELRHIPGVLKVEGERSIPVRLQFKHYRKEVTLISLEKRAELSRLLGKDDQPLEPIEGGVLVSRYFETVYGLRLGDQIDFKWLEGAQSMFRVPVLGFVDDVIGQQVYAQKGDLHRWLKEEPVFDTLQLKIDPAFADSIYVNLKERPEVASVTIRNLLLKSFSTTIAEMILTFTIILYAFAVAIAGAVMYNSARIGFSERAWELASLRILGFGLRPAFELLFMDIGVQVLLAVIPGLLLGYGLSYLSTHMIHNETFQFPLVIDPSTYGTALLVLMATFMFASYFLYRQIRQLDFSAALKARD